MTLALVLVALVLGGGLASLGYRALQLSQVTGAHWTNFRASSSPEARAISAVFGAMGYGGMIHHFRNFILRKDASRADHAQRRIGALIQTLDRLASLEDTVEKRETVALLQEVVASYASKVETAGQMAANGHSAREIDAAVREDVGPASAALETLLGILEASAGPESGQPAGQRRTILLARLYHALGYGGLIHMFKDYILLGDDASRAAFAASSERARDATAAYRTLDLTEFERHALVTIETMIGAYEKRLSLAVEMISDGATAEAIDRAVEFDDGPAEEAFAVLERALTARFRATERILTDGLQQARLISLLTLSGGVILGLGLIAGFVWVLLCKVVMPARQIAAVLGDSSGDCGISFPALDDRTEIGGIARAAASFHDRSVSLIRERKAALRDTEAHLNSIIDAATSAVVSMDGGGWITGVNPSAVTLFQCKATALIGQNISDLLDLPGPRQGDTALQALLERDPGTLSKGTELRGYRADGTAFPCRLSLGRSRLHDNTVYTAIVRDLTEWRKVERLKTEFVSTVSHELRTPLTSIKGSLGLMRSPALGELPAKARAMVEIADTNCDRLVRLINDILDLEKVESAVPNLAIVPCSVSEHVARAIDENGGFAATHGIALESAAIPGHWQIAADSDRLLQVLTNLISNAVKFSPQGETVTLAAAPGRDGTFRLSVTDRGPGIPEEFRDRIFHKFAQADAADTRRSGGTGLGLAISKSIAEAHGGAIGFDTREGMGTTFWVEFAAIASPVGTDGTGEPRKARILICEDDIDLGNFLQIMLRDAGLVAAVCRTVSDAESRLAQESFDAMTLDYGMVRDMSDSAVIGLRAAVRNHKVPVVIVSGRRREALPGSTDETFDFVEWVTKPIDSRLLRKGLRRALSGRTSEKPSILHVERTGEHAAIVREIVGETADIDVASTLDQARRRLATSAYDLVVLDLSLPDGRGEMLLPNIAATGPLPPKVLVHTAEEPSPQLKQSVDAVLVKSRTSNTDLRTTLEQLLDIDVAHRVEPGSM